MNFSREAVEQRTHKISSPNTKRRFKLQLITIRILLVLSLFAACLMISIVYGAFRSIIDSAPAIDEIQVSPQGYATTITDSQGKTLQYLVGRDANREYAVLDQIPSNLQNAFIAIEDERFWSHSGVDFHGILRAFATGIMNGGDFNQGASTLTQQLLKNQVFGGGEERTLFARLERKLQEQYLAVQLEKKYDKKQILEFYLNTINLGQNTLGVQAASKRYFNKDVSQLTLSECAVIAGITQNPSAYNPITHPGKNKQKRSTVLTYMREQGLVTTKEYNEAMADNVYERIQAVNQEIRQVSHVTSYFSDALIDQVVEDLKERLGYTETQAFNAIYTRGLTIISTQDQSVQKVCDAVVNDKKYYPEDSEYELTYRLTVRHADNTESNYDLDTMKRWYVSKKNKKISSLFKKKKDAEKLIRPYRKAVVKKGDTIVAETKELVIQPQASFVLMNQHTGEVLALCGGRGAKTGSRTLNRAVSSARQPGSTFKVLSTYLPALDISGMTLATVQDDAKYYYPGTKKVVKNWYGSSYRGLTSMRTAIADSMNVIAVKTLEQVTPKTGYDYLQNLGFTTLVDSYTDSSGKTYTDITLPMALGGLTKGVTNLELTSGFAAVASGGTWHRPVFYSKVMDHDGNVLLDNTEEKGVRVMKDSTAWLLTSAMQDVIYNGTGKQLKFKKLQMPQAGKTGTTTGSRDLWFVGYTPYYTAGIWGGYDNSSKQKNTSYHKEIWRTIMEKINHRKARTTFKKPKSVTSTRICTKCGKLAIKDLCDQAVGGSCSKLEYFSRESLPAEKCDCHVRRRICRSSQRPAGDNCPPGGVYSIVYLQKKETDSDHRQNTADNSLIIPDHLTNSLCQIH